MHDIREAQNSNGKFRVLLGCKHHSLVDNIYCDYCNEFYCFRCYFQHRTCIDLAGLRELLRKNAVYEAENKALYLVGGKQ